MRDSGLVDPEVDFDEVAEMLPRVSGELERTRTVCRLVKFASVAIPVV